jgi:RHS repeat-associated protein
LDASGNRTQERVYDLGGTLARTRSRVYDALNRLAQDLGAQGQTTTYGYDGNGNVTSASDPLSHATANSYDALNRLTQVLDPAGGTTQYAYDGAHNLTQATDPRGLATAYTYDGLNNPTKLVSPDTGTTTSTYDAAGNLLTKVDARGATASYTVDALNRVTAIVYSKGGTPDEPHAFTDDTGANAKGRLTQLVDPAATTKWTYTAHGRVASKTQVTGSVSRSLTYGYNAAGQLATVTTPSGQQIEYTYLNNRLVGVTVNGATLAAGIVSTPFGPVGAWQWGNGLYTFRYYDTDGRLNGWEFRNGATVLRNDLSFDTASRITAVANPITPAAAGGYQYDALDRLTVAQQGNPVTRTQQFSYDALGSRASFNLDGAAATLYYGSNTHQLQSMVGVVSPTYLGGATSLTYTYNNANRLAEVKSSGATLATYAINGLGQRVRKDVGLITTVFVYDEQGRILGEYDGTGQLIQETVWLDDLPIATLRPTGTGTPTPIAVHYVHADHLGSPRAVTRPADNQLLWQWDNTDPFGNNAANENPAGLGTFRYNLRFPGQYYDAETGTHYNYFRDYDPAVGRYEQSDPIGLRGGLNTYAYVGSFPIGDSDAEGLQRVLPGPVPLPIPGPIAPIPPRPGDPVTGIPVPPTPSPIERFWRWLCRDDDDPECEKFRERDEARCSLVARPRYGKKGFKLCMDSAAVRFAECRRFGPGGVTTPLHGVDTQL